MSGADWTLMEFVRWTADFFKQHDVPQARLDAELLLAHVLGASRMDLYMSFDKPLGEADRARFRELVRRRAKERVPVAYLLERREFWSLPFRVTPDVLIPRPETETLVRVALDRKPRRALEIGAGQSAAVVELLRATGAAEVETFADLAGITRVVLGLYVEST